MFFIDLHEILFTKFPMNLVVVSKAIIEAHKLVHYGTL